MATNASGPQPMLLQSMIALHTESVWQSVGYSPKDQVTVPQAKVRPFGGRPFLRPGALPFAAGYSFHSAPLSLRGADPQQLIFVLYLITGLSALSRPFPLFSLLSQFPGCLYPIFV